MKYLFILFIICSSTTSFSQTEDQQYENAYFLVHQKGEHAFTTEVVSNTAIFTDDEFKIIKTHLLQKEGIFRVDFSKNSKSILVYHLSYIEVETIKDFVTPIVESVDFKERVIYTF